MVIRAIRAFVAVKICQVSEELTGLEAAIFEGAAAIFPSAGTRTCWANLTAPYPCATLNG